MTDGPRQMETDKSYRFKSGIVRRAIAPDLHNTTEYRWWFFRSMREPHSAISCRVDQITAEVTE